MKRIVFLSAAIVLVATTGCKKDQPAYICSGEFLGSFNALYQDSTYLVDNTHWVKVSQLDKNNIHVEGEGFLDFDLLVVDNGLNIERVDPYNPIIVQFDYIGADKQLKFRVEDEMNDDWAYFYGTKK